MYKITHLTIILLTALIAPLHAGEVIIKDSDGLNCYIYSPKNIDQSRTYQLVVGVHGYRGEGKGAAGIANWANKFDCIVVGPSFLDGYQGAPPRANKKLLKLIKEVGSQYPISKKFFLYGHSGGAQFAHRFTFASPKSVLGCCATSAGSWATGGMFGSINSSAKKVPFFIGCGENDTSTSVAGYPHSRIDWFKLFSKKLKAKNFNVTEKIFAGKSHGLGAEGKSFAEEAYKSSLNGAPAPTNDNAGMGGTGTGNFSRPTSIAGKDITGTRTWTSNNGKKISAKLLAIGGTKEKPICTKDGNITLLKKYKKFTIPLSSLSQQDQDYINNLSSK